MHLLTNKNPIPMGAGVALQPGTWLMEDLDAARMMTTAGGGECQLTLFNPHPGMAQAFHDFGGTVTVVRPGRYGDLILLTPTLREIKRRWPTCTLQVSCLPHYRDALIGLPYIDNFLPYPLPMNLGDGLNYGALTSLEVLTALFEREPELHMADLFAERLGLDSLATKKPDFILSPDELAWAHDAYPRTKHNRVAIQIKSSTPSRDYPMLQMGDVIRRLHGRGWDVVLLGLPHEIVGKNEDRITNCAKDQLTFRQSAAVLATADVFLGPDSSLIHVAGAIGTPAVGLFSVVPWQLRTKYCPTTFVIQAKQGCDLAPCFHAPRGAMGFPAAGPCQKERKCCALDTILPMEVVSKVEQMLTTARVSG